MARGGTRLTVLATSWRRLKLPNERPFALGPLACSSTDGTDPATRLFLERARAVTDRELEGGDVRALVEALEGVPLALELAATAMGVLTPGQLMARRELLLDVTAEDEIWASRPLRHALTLSWDPLGDAEKAVFAACSTFQGSFPLDAVQALVPAEPAARVLRSLQTLVDHSLVRVERAGDEMRFRMFASVRHFAGEQLAARGELPSMRKRHAAYFGERARARVLTIPGAARIASTRWLLENEENLLAVVRGEDADDSAAMWSMAGLLWVALGRGPLEPYAQTFSRVVARLEGTGAALPEAHGHLLLGGSGVHRHLGDLERAERFATEALDAARRARDRRLESMALVERARCAENTGRSALAARWLDEARAIAEATSDAWSELAICFAQPRPEADEIALERVVSLAVRSGDPVMVVRAEAAMASRLAADGRNEEALERVRRMSAVAEELGERTWRMHAERIAGAALADEGRLGDARRRFQSALAHARSTGYRTSEGEALGCLGLLEFERGELPRALVSLREAIAKLHPHEPASAVLQSAIDAVEAELDPTSAPRSSLDRSAVALDEGQRAAIATFEAMAKLARARGDTPPAPPPVPASPSIDARVARRLYDRACALARPPETAWLVARDASWFRTPGAQRTDLSTRPLLRTLLQLVQGTAKATPWCRGSGCWPRSGRTNLGEDVEIASRSVSTLQAGPRGRRVTTHRGSGPIGLRVLLVDPQSG